MNERRIPPPLPRGKAGPNSGGLELSRMESMLLALASGPTPDPEDSWHQLEARLPERPPSVAARFSSWFRRPVAVGLTAALLSTGVGYAAEVEPIRQGAEWVGKALDSILSLEATTDNTGDQALTKRDETDAARTPVSEPAGTRAHGKHRRNAEDGPRGPHSDSTAASKGREGGQASSGNAMGSDADGEADEDRGGHSDEARVYRPAPSAGEGSSENGDGSAVDDDSPNPDIGDDSSGDEDAQDRRYSDNGRADEDADGDEDAQDRRNSDNGRADEEDADGEADDESASASSFGRGSREPDEPEDAPEEDV